MEDDLTLRGARGAGTQSDPRQPSRGDSLILLGLLLLMALAATLSPIRNYDYWWHLRTGALILEEKMVPRADPYSFTAPGFPWVDHEWLAQVVMYLGHVLLGPPILVLLKSALVIGLSLLILKHLRREGHGPAGASALILLALVGASFRLDVRPELATLILVPLTLHLVIRARDGGRPGLLAAVVAVAAIGINLHAGVLLVPVLLAAGAFCSHAAAILRGRDRADAAGDGRRFAWRLTWATIGAALAIALNPWGFEVYAVPFRLRRLLGNLTLQNQEWIRPTPDQFPFFFASLALATIVLIAGMRHADPVAAPALVLCGALAALHARNIGLFFLVLPYGLARPARGLVESVKTTRLYRWGTGGERVRPGFIAAAAFLVLGLPLLLFLPPTPSFGLGMASDNEPSAAADFLEREDIGRRLFNDVRFGGYLIWRRHPGDQVFIDGRNEIYGALLSGIEKALRGPDRWKALIDTHGIDAALLRYPPALQKVVYPGLDGRPPRTGERAFSSAYFPASDWALVYWDDDAMIFLRRQPEHAALIERLEYHALNPDDWRYLWAGVLIRRIPVEPILVELQRKLQEDPGCARAQELMRRFALFLPPAAGAAPSPPPGG